MTDRLVAKGDGTTTRGCVLGGSSSFYAENGQTLACRNDLATCGNCEGSFPIYGTADTILDEGRPLVRHMDRVLCPCKQNFALSAQPDLLIRDGDESRTTLTINQERVTEHNRFDERVRVINAFDGYPYFIETTDRRAVSGRVDSGRTLPRVMSGDSADDYIVYWGDDALAKSNGNCGNAE